jgi:hypothetical protein
MTTFNRTTHDRFSGLTAALTEYAEAGIDPAFDTEMEELERQFAELRLTTTHN